MQTYGGTGSTASLTPNLGTILRVPQPLYPRGKSLQFPLDRRLNGLQSRSEPVTLLGIEPRFVNIPAHIPS
jgi:hypothetical protein